jgi:hypothetical protein
MNKYFLSFPTFLCLLQVVIARRNTGQWAFQGRCDWDNHIVIRKVHFLRQRRGRQQYV